MTKWQPGGFGAFFKISTLATVLSFGLVACGEDTPTASVGAASGAYNFEIFDDDLVVGEADAPITIIEYSSFTCPHCAEFHHNIYPELKKKYIDTGKAKMVFRPFFWDGPAANAAMLSYCAPSAIRMPLTDALFASQRLWMGDSQGPVEGLVKIARQANISRESFADCKADPKTNAWAQKHLDDAQNKYQFSSTPSFLVNGEKTGPIRNIADIDRIMAKFTGESPSE